MWARQSVVLLFFVLQPSFTADTPRTLREKYGQPIGETFRVKPGVVISATYGEGGDVCEIVISPEKPYIVKSGNKRFKAGELASVIDEVVPRNQRGKFLMGIFDDGACLPDADCSGVTENYEDVIIYRNGSTNEERYATIQWRRNECHAKLEK